MGKQQRRHRGGRGGKERRRSRKAASDDESDWRPFKKPFKNITSGKPLKSLVKDVLPVLSTASMFIPGLNIAGLAGKALGGLSKLKGLSGLAKVANIAGKVAKYTTPSTYLKKIPALRKIASLAEHLAPQLGQPMVDVRPGTLMNRAIGGLAGGGQQPTQAAQAAQGTQAAQAAQGTGAQFGPLGQLAGSYAQTMAGRRREDALKAAREGLAGLAGDTQRRTALGATMQPRFMGLLDSLQGEIEGKRGVNPYQLAMNPAAARQQLAMNPAAARRANKRPKEGKDALALKRA